MDGGVVDGDAALRHHLLEIAQAQAVSEIPADAEQDQRAIEMAAFEHLAPPERAGGVRRTELPKSLQQILRNRASSARMSSIVPGRRPWGTCCHSSRQRRSSQSFKA